ncbi:hypothetical protein FHY12_003162 [Xanthomonas arboricola]|uniref:DUF4435 domain-containing protein n=1 Tax=Xanthomonas euroxanthea TaxID=2259622 RepID=UPI00141B5A5F|nr:DUF4435 domain-containing protein [Xanthomonas euroxanthea]NIK40837.1 hypothetical protein [Xanthomonas euroxanthea]
MIERSLSGKFAKHKFFTKYNDIDVFIEDTAIGSKKIFTEILRRLIDGGISINCVFPIGPKAAVVKKCQYDQGFRDRKAIYIIDGDYDVALSRPAPTLKRIYRLKRYCIENYLLDDSAIASVINDSELDKDFQSIVNDLDMISWRRNVTPHLNEVARALVAASIKTCDRLPTVKIDLREIQAEVHDKIDPIKAKEFVQKYRTEIDKKHGQNTFLQTVQKFDSLNGGTGIDFNLHASGKSLILPLLRKRIERKLNFDLTDFPLFKARLASRCDISELKDLVEMIH